MGRTIAYPFFHPYEVESKKKNKEINLKNWLDKKNSPFYYEQIPIYLNKTYRGTEIELEHECNSKIPSKQILPQIAVLDKFIEELKTYITHHKLYESVKYNINYEKEIPEILGLVKSHKLFMYYLHIPQRSYGLWFAEGRFFNSEEIANTPEEKIFQKINKLVEKKKINYMDFLEEWVGLIFHLICEYLLFKKKLKVIFYSCDKCYRPGIFIKGELDKSKPEDDADKIWGTINIVDTIIYNYTKSEDFKLDLNSQRSRNNIIYYNELYDRETQTIPDLELFKNETDGAFILTMNDLDFDNLLKEIKRKEKIYKFDLIISCSTTSVILAKLDSFQNDDNFDRIIFYNSNLENYSELENIYDKIKGKLNKREEIIKFIHSKNQNSEIYQTVKLLTYDEYTHKYMPLHKYISSFYGKVNDNCFKIAISYLKDFLLWNPQLNLKKKGGEKKLQIELLLESLQTFKGINDNEEDIINLYTKEESSYYQDFNNWLFKLDPLAIQKTSWFIAAVIFSLNKYAKKNKKGLKKDNMKLYRGINASLTDLLYYETAKDKLICFPSFTSTSESDEIAKSFLKEGNHYKTLITINYKYKEGFFPTAIDISKISSLKGEKECNFLPYSFFRVNYIEIDHHRKEANIELDSIGRKEIFESSFKEGDKLVYNQEGYMEVNHQS